MILCAFCWMTCSSIIYLYPPALCVCESNRNRRCEKGLLKFYCMFDILQARRLWKVTCSFNCAGLSADVTKVACKYQPPRYPSHVCPPVWSSLPTNQRRIYRPARMYIFYTSPCFQIYTIEYSLSLVYYPNIWSMIQIHRYITYLCKVS